MEQHLKLDDTGVLLDEHSRYPRFAGHLIYLRITRPDKAYSVNILSQFMHQRRQIIMNVALRLALRLIRHLKTTMGKEFSCHLLALFN